MEQCIKINDTTWRFEDEGVRFFLLCGKEKAALVDTGMKSPDARKLAEELTDLPLILINTHADRDHISGNDAFDEFYMSPAEEENYRQGGGKGTILPVKEGDVIELGDRPLRIIDIPGHTPGSIAILDEKNRVLISGDSVQDGRIFMFGPMRDLSAYVLSLKRLLERNEDIKEIYPSHGAYPLGTDVIPELIAGAEKIESGMIKPKRAEMFGNIIDEYDIGIDVLLCDAGEKQQ